MATIELSPLSERLDPEQLELATEALLAEVGHSVDLASDEDARIVDNSIDDDLFTDFRDRLEANDLDADIYVPVEFEETLVIGELRLASTYALQLVLDSLREDFFVDLSDDGDDEDDELDDDFQDDLQDEDQLEDSGTEMKDEQLRHIWHVIYKAAEESIETNTPIFLFD